MSEVILYFSELEKLKTVTTDEERQKLRKRLFKMRDHLLATNQDFKANFEVNKIATEQRKHHLKHRISTSFSEVNAFSQSALQTARQMRVKANIQRIEAEQKIDKIKNIHCRARVVEPEKLEKKMEDKLGCPNPKCEDHGKNRGNIMNDTPTCMRCYHKLVPKSKFKDYNRKYWRRFNKKKKTRRRTH